MTDILIHCHLRYKNLVSYDVNSFRPVIPPLTSQDDMRSGKK